MASGGGTAVFSNVFNRRNRETDLERQVTDGTAEELAPQTTGQTARSRLANIPSRIQNFNFREWQVERRERQERARIEVERIVHEINQLRRANLNRHAVHFGGGGLEARQTGDLEAGGANGDPATATLSMRKITGKSRREREEGATLFGPNLANYFGSGSSTSGAIAGASLGTNSNPTAAAVAAVTAANGDGSTPQNTLRRPRLGSRGRARGASLSGLSQYSLHNADESVLSLTSPTLNGQPSLSKIDGSYVADSDPNEIPMAEGIELDTLRTWIERSTVGGTVEVNNAQEAAQLRGTPGNPNTVCTTLQSYVNLKRNTVKLVALPEEASQMPTQTLNDPLQTSSPLATHSIHFEYDCAAPFASVQVFVRASRKHGSWVTWTSAREQAGLPIDLTIGAEDDGESRFYGQRGPPPHVLGWPVFVSRTRKGFSVPLSVQVALKLDFYAPPKVSTGVETSTLMKSMSTEANLVPETPGLDVSRRLDEPETPAVIGGFDPLSLIRSNETGQLPSALPGVAAAVAGQQANEQPATNQGGVETKEEKAARERAERETLKIAVVVEALDEDGKPLREPNLQTTYMRIASLPVRTVEGQIQIVESEQVAQEAMEGGDIHDIALPLSSILTNDKENSGNSSQLTPAPNTKRAWSVQIEGQEAEIGPHRFQLQELYGLSSRPPPPQQQQQAEGDNNQENGEGADENGATADTALPPIGNGEDGNASECLICLSAPPTTLLLPCTHGLCLDCAVQLRDTVKATRESERRRGRRPKRKYACPVCRRVYSSMLHLSAMDEKSLAQQSTTV